MPRVNAICRSCAAMCPLLVDVEDNRPVNIIGDKDNPVFHGYSCIKGREMVNTLHHPDRLYKSMKRLPNGEFVEIASETALDEITERLQAIIAEHGPRAVATYAGTFIFTYPTTQPIQHAWMDALGSPMRFTAASIDQPGKAVAPALHGSWQAGAQVFDDADTWLLVGVNPLVAKSGGVPNQNPAKRLKDAVEKNGMQLVVIDPRRTECAQWAAVHLQPRPGEDPTVLAGIIRVIIEEQLYDAEFVAENAAGFEQLRAQVDGFTPEYVAQRAGVPAEELLRAARVFGSAQRGGCTAGTGTNMAGRGNLTEYLLMCLMTLCGRWLKAGERVPNPGVMGPKFTPRAQANAPYKGWGLGEKLRVRGFTNTAVGMPTSALADEILLDGEGQIKALICISGNPLLAWPDQEKTLAALKKLDLFVCLDLQIANNSCHLADYVMACKHSLEAPAITLPNEMLSYFGAGFGFSEPYAQYAPATVEPLEGSDLIEEWEFFYGLARRMDLPLEFDVAYSWAVTGQPPPHISMDMQNKPSTDELFERITEQARVPLATVKQYPAGHVFDDEAVYVDEKQAGWTARLQLADPTMMAELDEVLGEPPDHQRFTGYPFRLISRRTPDVFNSTGRNNPKQLRKYKFNPAFMNPSDAASLGIVKGDVIHIESPYSDIRGIVELEEGIRPGVISMTHCFGGDPERNEDIHEKGSATNRLISVETHYDPYTGIPRMSAVPVRVSKHQ
ncbi:MAG TPA: molybdopterin-dependent oxidoreductase [Spongiibacteraceae bacterium]|nr:molybdopterin-dependent oxidoreductase [Spongiibacteraceae bacterium]HUH37723.1 molybdopterin-dependent oxidoreductase [Spongiibacteraceae bacterium]